MAPKYIYIHIYIYIYIYIYNLAPTHFDLNSYPQGKYIRILIESTQCCTVVLNILNVVSAGIDTCTFFSSKAYLQAYYIIISLNFMFCWPCLSIDPYNENQLDAPFILSLFRQSTSTCFGHICSPSSGGILYICNNWYVLWFSVDSLLAGFQPGQQ